MSRKRKPPGAAPAPGEGLSTSALVLAALLLAAAVAAYAILAKFNSAAILAQFRSPAPAAKPEAAKAFVPLAGLAADAQQISAEAGFLRWLSRNGARVASVRLAQIPGMGRGVVAASALATGDELFALPASLVLSDASVRRTTAGAAIARSVAKLRGQLRLAGISHLLAMWLLREARVVGDASPWWPYLRLVEATSCDAPLCWGDELRAVLDGQPLLALQVQRTHAELAADFELLVRRTLEVELPELFPPGALQLADFVAQVHFQNTHLWTTGDGPEQRRLDAKFGRMYLPPLADMLNNAPWASADELRAAKEKGARAHVRDEGKVDFKLEDGEGGSALVFRARRAVAAGEQVLDRPPIADHATLFLRGGFSMPGARYTTLTLPTPQWLSGAQPRPELRARLLDAAYSQLPAYGPLPPGSRLPAGAPRTVPLYSDGAIPPTLLAGMRALHAQLSDDTTEEDAAALEEASKAHKPLAVADDAAAVESLRAVFGQEIARHSSDAAAAAAAADLPSGADDALSGPRLAAWAAFNKASAEVYQAAVDRLDDLK